MTKTSEITTIKTEPNSNKVQAVSSISLYTNNLEELKELDNYSIIKARQYLIERYSSEDLELKEENLRDLIHSIVGHKYETAIFRLLSNINLYADRIIKDVFEILKAPLRDEVLKTDDIVVADVMMIDCIGREIKNRERIKEYIISEGSVSFDKYYAKVMRQNSSSNSWIKDQRQCVMSTTQATARPMYKYNHHTRFYIAEWWLSVGIEAFTKWKYPLMER